RGDRPRLAALHGGLAAGLRAEPDPAAPDPRRPARRERRVGHAAAPGLGTAQGIRRRRAPRQRRARPMTAGAPAERAADAPLSRAEASRAVEAIGWRYLLGNLAASVPVA